MRRVRRRGGSSPSPCRTTSSHKLDMELIEGIAELGSARLTPQATRLDFRGARLRGDRARRGGAARCSVHVGLNSRATDAEQKQRWLRAGARRKLASLRADHRPRRDARNRATRLRAQRPEELDLARPADHARFAKTDPAAAHKGISAFVLEKGMPGFTSRDQENKLGIWAGSTGELFFENVEVPAENLIGEEGQGSRSRCTHSTTALHVARRAASCAPASSGRSSTRASETFGQEIGRTSSSRT